MVDRRVIVNKAKFVITLALVLLVGILAGSLGTRMYLKHEPRSSEDRVKKIVQRLTDDLRLDAAQKAEVEKMVTRTDARAAALRASYQPELKKIYDRDFELLGTKLNDNQKAKLRARHERFSLRFNALYFRSLRTAQKAIPDVNAL